MCICALSCFGRSKDHFAPLAVLVGLLDHFAPLAQLVEQIPLKDKVEGSIPSGRTLRIKVKKSVQFFLNIGRRYMF